MRKIVSLVQLVITIALISFIIFKLDISFSKMASALTDMSWLIFAVIFRVICMPFFAGMRTKIFLQYAGINENVFKLMSITFISVFWGMILPTSSGHDAIRMYLIEKENPNKRGRAGATVVAERLFGVLLLCSIGLLGSFIVEGMEDIRRIRLVATIVTLMVAGLIILVTNKKIYRCGKDLMGRVTFATKVTQYVNQLHASLIAIPLRNAVPRALPFMLLFQLSTIVLAYLLFKAFGVNLSFTYYLTIMPIIQIITLIPVFIGGFGIREGAFVYFFSLLGIDASISFSVSILYYMVSVGTVATMGAILSLYKQVKKKDLVAGNPDTNVATISKRGRL